MLPDVVTCITRTRPLASGKPLAAVFNTYHDAPVKVVLVRFVAPGVKKYGVMACVASSTIEGSAAPTMPEVDAGPDKPIVAYVSSAKSGNTGKNAGLMPEAFQELLKALLNAPAGVFTNKLAWSLPNTALMRSVASCI